MITPTKLTPLSLICLSFIHINYVYADPTASPINLCAGDQVSIWKSTTIDPGNAPNGSISFEVSQETLYLDIGQAKAIMENIHSNSIEGVYNNGKEDCNSGKFVFKGLQMMGIMVSNLSHLIFQ